MTPEGVHKLAAALILVFVVFALAKGSGRLRARYLLPFAVLGLGLLLLLDPIVFHGGDFGAEGIQHQAQGALLLGVAAVEFARERGKLSHRAFGGVLPLAIVMIGISFVVHTQNGGGDLVLQVVQHRILGATVILAGLVKAADSLKLARGNWAAIGWLLLLLAVSMQLFLYVEGGEVASHDASPRASPPSHHAPGMH